MQKIADQNLEKPLIGIIFNKSYSHNVSFLIFIYLLCTKVLNDFLGRSYDNLTYYC